MICCKNKKIQTEEKWMRKRVITALMLTVALALAPISGGTAMIVNAEENAAAVNEEEAATVSDGDAAGGDSAATEEKTQLAAPTGLQWGEQGIITWNAVDSAEGYYGIELYRDGTRVTGSSGRISTLNEGIYTFAYIRPHICESGAYQFRVQSMASYDPDHYEDSEWSELSPVYNYVKPDAVLGNVTCYWSDSNPGTLCWRPVEGMSGYEVHVYQYQDSTGSDRSLGTIYNYNPGLTPYPDEVRSVDITSYIDRHGAGKYRCTVKALSGDIEAIANGNEGEFSEYYDTAAAANTISGIISGAMENATAGEALETIKSEIDKASLRTAMQTDGTVLDQIRSLENAYAAEQGITVNAPAVSKEAGAYVNADAISVVGAGLNAAAGQEVRLEVSVPAEKEYVPDQHYANSVQLDIQLKRGGESVHELEIPVTITLPVPKGLDAKRLVVLHYSEDGSFETVDFRDNGDGTVTFTVSRFSTFAFAEQKADGDGQTISSSDSGNEDASDAQDDIVDRIVNAGSGEVIRIKGVTALSNSVMQELLKKGNVTLVLEYTYEGVDYVVTIPAGAAVNSDIPWYGPLYLAGRYGNNAVGAAGVSGDIYTVRAGDTMGKIARVNGMTLNQLAAKNPQVKNLDYIVVGQKIYLR